MSKTKKKAGALLKISPFWALALFITILSAYSWQAFASFISPPILTIENNQRSAQFILNNRGNMPKIYRFSWEHRVLQPDGSLKKIPEGEPYPEGYQPADPYLRFSPRQVRVEPKSSQRVNFLVQRPADMAEGEYRSHFLIEDIPLARQKLKDPLNPQGTSGQIELRVNKSVPVLLRHGKTKLDLTIAQARLSEKDGKPAIALTVKNNSTRTDYSTVMLNCKTDSGEVKKLYLSMSKFYPNIKEYPLLFPTNDFPLSDCKSMEVQIIGSRFDPEYSNKVLATASVSR